MQSPLLHQMSSIRDSLMHDDHHPFNLAAPGSSMHPGTGLRPRAPHSGIPLSSLASSSSGPNILAATVLDISAASPRTPSNSHSIPDQAQPQSKSEQDLAHYLATSNLTPDSIQSQSLRSSLNREPTLLHSSLSAEWNSHPNGLSEVFDRGGAFISWGELSAAPTAPPPAGEAPSSSTSPPETTVQQLYNPRGEYFSPAPAIAAPSASQIDTWSSDSTPNPSQGSESYRLPTVTQSSHSHTPSPALVPLSLPLPTSLLRVNVNTGPRLPIQHDSPHLRADANPPYTDSPHTSALSPYATPVALPHAVHTHPRSGASSPFPALELGYPSDDGMLGDATPRYVNLSDLMHPAAEEPGPSTGVEQEKEEEVVLLQSSAGGSKRRGDEGDAATAGTQRKRLCLRDRPGTVRSNSGSSGDGLQAQAQEASEEDEGEEDSEDDDDGSDFDADDSGEFVPGRSTSSRPRRRLPQRGAAIKREASDDDESFGAVSVSASQRRRRRSGSGPKTARAKRHTGSAAAALRAVTELALSAGGGMGNAQKAQKEEGRLGGLDADLGMQPAVKAEMMELEYVDAAGGAGHMYGVGSGSEAQQQQQYSMPFASTSAYVGHGASFHPPPTPGAPQQQQQQQHYPAHTYGHQHPNAHTHAHPNGMSQHPAATYYDLPAPTPPPAPVRRNAQIPLPVPVPNLIKKSRGRRVPTPSPASGPTPGPDGEARAFVCSVEGCGKGFVRGEHLKRHVRSIHTYEKPYQCPYDGCGKVFSRRDNLAQHSRVHLPG